MGGKGAAYIYMADDFGEGDGADSVGATSAATDGGADGDEGRCCDDGGRRWRSVLMEYDGVGGGGCTAKM